MAEHRNLTGAALHEPKGVENAAPKTVYTADGAGSGSWQAVEVVGASTAPAGSAYVATGTGAEWRPIRFARLSVSNVAITHALTGGGIHDPASYFVFSGDLGIDHNVGFTIDPVTKILTAQTSGWYRVEGWVALSASVTSCGVGFDLSLNGVAGAPSSPVVRMKLKTAGDIDTLTGFGIAYLNAGDTLGAALAVDTTATLTIYEAVLDIERVA